MLSPTPIPALFCFWHRMDPYEELAKPIEVEDSEKVVARNINLATQQICRLIQKVNDKDEVGGVVV